MTGPADRAPRPEQLQVPEFPPFVMFDLTNICNLQCVHCPSVDLMAAPDFEPEQLDYGLFCKAIDEMVAHGVTSTRLTANGEPLLHKRLEDLVRYAKDAGVKIVNVTTNARTLTEARAVALLEAGVDIFDISLDAFSKEAYLQVRKGSNYEKVMANVHRLVELRSQRGAGAQIIVTMIDQPLVHAEVEPFRAYWEPRVDKVVVRPMHTMGGEREAEGLRPPPARYPCPYLWRRVVIDHGGNISYCPVDFFQKSVLGNLREHTIAEVWRGEAYRVLRQHHVENTYPTGSFCGTCIDWASTSWHLGWEDALTKLGAKPDTKLQESSS